MDKFLAQKGFVMVVVAGQVMFGKIFGEKAEQRLSMGISTLQ